MAWSHSPGQLAMVHFDVVVVVPRLAGAVPDLHEAHAALDQPAGDQDLPGLHARAVHVAGCACGSRLTSNASAASDLHAIGQLERLDAGFELRRRRCRACRCAALSCRSRSSCRRCSSRPTERSCLMFSISFSISVCLRVDVGALVDAGQESRPASSAIPGSDSRRGTWR